MESNFRKALAVTLKWEGGFVNHPADPGGATNKGITLATYRRYKKGATVADLKRIPRSMVERIYRDGYWDKVNGDRLAPGVDLATFDYAVNSGPAAARKNLHKVLGGPDYRTVQRLCRRRLSIYKTFRHWAVFGKGWTRRINAIEAKGVAWAKDGGQKRLADEAAKMDARADQQEVGGAGGGLAGTAGAWQLPDWMFLVAMLLVVGAVAFAVWKARQNRHRARAYEKEMNNELD